MIYLRKGRTHALQLSLTESIVNSRWRLLSVTRTLIDQGFEWKSEDR